MRVCSCFLLLRIFAYTLSVAPNSPRANDRSVKLALETVLEFNDKDKAGDITILDNVRNFITKVKTAIDKTSNFESYARRDITAPTVDTFTGFFQEVVKILNTYDNAKFTDFIDILDEQMRQYHYRGCKFRELTDSSELKKLIALKLELIKRTPASDIKANMNTLSDSLRNENYDKNIKKIVDEINSLYGQDDEEKFQKVLSDLAAFGKTKSKKFNTNLSKIIKNGVRSIIFDHYTNLNTNVRRNFKRKIETFLKQLNENPSSKDYKPNRKTSENILNEVKWLKPVSKKYIASKKANAKIETNQKNKADRAKVKQSDYKNGGMKRDNLKDGQKRYKNTRINIDRPLVVQEKAKILSPQNTGPTVPQRAKIKRQEQTSYIDASSSQSLEFYQEPKDNRRQNKAMNFENIPQKSISRKKTEKIKSVNLITSKQYNTNQNIWIEESTGRLPQAVLDKLAVKARRHETDYYNTVEAVNKRGTKHNKKYDKKRKSWHEEIHEPKYGKGHDKKNETKRLTKHRSKYDSLHASESPDLMQKLKKRKILKSDKNTKLSKPSMLIHNKDHSKKIDDSTIKSVFKMERHKYKKRMEPIRAELNSRQADGASAAAAQAEKFIDLLDVQMTLGTSGNNIKPHRGNSSTTFERLAIPSRIRTQRRYDWVRRKQAAQQTAAEFAPQKVDSKRNKMLSRKFAAKQLQIKQDKRTEAYLKEAQEAQPFNSLEKNLHVIRKINNLEKEIQEVKNIINEPEVKKEKQYETRYVLNANRVINDSKQMQDKVETAGTVDNKTEVIIKNENVQKTAFKNKKIKDNIEEAESQINVNADAAVMKERDTDASQMTRDTLLKTTQIATNTQKFLIKTVKAKNFGSIHKDKISEIKLRSNDVKDRRIKEATMTRKADNKTDTTQTDIDFNDDDSENNEIKDNTEEVRSKNNVNADIVKMKDVFEIKRDRLLKKSETTNKNKEFLIKQVKDHDFKNKDEDKMPEKVFRSDVNLIPNDLKDKQTDMIGKDLKNNEMNDSIEDTKSRVKGHADDMQVRKNQQSYKANEIKPKLSEIKSTPDINGKIEPVQSLNYNVIKENLEKTKDKMNINVDDMKASQVNLKDPQKEIKEKLKQSEPKLGLDANKNNNGSDNNQDRLIEAAKIKLIRPVVGHLSKTKVHKVNKNIEPEASFRSDGDKVLNDVQNTAEKINATGTKNKTDIKERNKSSKINDYQTTTVTKQQIFFKEDKKTKTSISTEDGKKTMRVRADGNATEGTKTGEKQLASTTSTAPTPTKSTAATTEGSTTTVASTSRNTLKTSSIVVVSLAATPSQLPPLPVAWTTNKPL